MASDVERENRYEKERSQRWELGEKGEPIIAKAVRDIVKALRKARTDVVRYDELWFEKYSPEENEWVRGCPDYYIQTENGEVFYIEVKVKSKPWDATIGGNKWKRIPRYGCASHYLDEEPVYKNMNDFCVKTGLNKNNFLIVFSDINKKDLRVISLQEIVNLISTGYLNSPIGRYSGGYGINNNGERATSFLIPVDAMKNANDSGLNEYLSKHFENKVILPEKKKE